MLNLKKGLAVVLAAATALTFAPVANLGQTVSAYASGESAVVTGSTSTAKATVYGLTAGSYSVVLASGKKTNGLKLTVSAVSAANGVAGVTAGSFTKFDGSEIITVSKASDNTVTSADVTFTAAYDGTGTGDLVGANGPVSVLVKKVNKDAAGSDIQDATTHIYQLGATVTGGQLSFTIKGVAEANVASVTGDDSVATSATALPAEASGKYTLNQGTTYGAKVTAKMSSSDSYANETSATSTAGVTYTYSQTNDILDIGDAGAANTDKTQDKTAEYGYFTISARSAGSTKLTVTASYNDNGTVRTASKTLNIDVSANYAGNITQVTWADPSDSKLTYLTSLAPADRDTNETKVGTSITLDPVINRTVQVTTVADGAVTYSSSDDSVATVSANGLITAVKPGTATITIDAAGTTNKNHDSKTISVSVVSNAKDQIVAKNGDTVLSATKGIDLDLSTSTAANAVKSVQVNATSKGGAALVYQLVSNKVTNAVADPAIASVSGTGLVTAGAKDGSIYLRITAGTVTGVGQADDLYIPVIVNKLPADDIAQGDINLDKGETYTLASGYQYSVASTSVASVAGTTLKAKDYGATKLTITKAATSTTRRTSKQVNVYVFKKDTKADSALSVTSDENVKIAVGETSKIVASGAAIIASVKPSYTSDDTSVATVDADGTITAVAAGTAVITVATPETDNFAAGQKFVKVTVTAPVQKLAKVTGVKVTNLKGGKVKVTWKKSTNPNVKYYVKKTVGKKSAGKSVGSNSTTLTVKKGATVKVKVKAYIYDENGEKFVGSYSSTVSKKTDKK